MIPLILSTASQVISLGPFVDSTDGNTAKTALTIANTDIKIRKHGSTSEVSKNSGGATHIASGRYYATLDATDTDTLGPMRISVHVSGALAVWIDCCVYPVNVYNALILGTGDGVRSDVRSLLGVSQSATDLKDFADDGYDPSTNKLVGEVVLADASLTTAKLGTFALAKTTNITGFNDLSTAQVNTECDTALADYDAPTNAEMVARTLVAASYATAANQTVIVGYLDTEIAAILAAVDTEVGAIKAVTDKIDTALVLDGSVYQFTVNALELAPSGGGGGVSDWTANEKTAIRSILGIPASGSVPDDPSSGILDTIRDKFPTNSQLLSIDASGFVTLANGSLVTAKLGTFILSKTTNITGFNDLSTAQVNTECDTALADYDAPTNAEMVARTVTTATYATAASQTTINSNITVVNNNVTTVGGLVTSVKATTDKVDTALVLDGSVYQLTANALELSPSGSDGSSLTVQEIVDGVCDELLSAHTVPGSLAAAVSAAGVAGDPLTGEVETGVNLKEAMQLMLSFMFGHTVGGGTSEIKFKDINNTKYRVVMTVDENANRISVTRDLT